MKTDAICILKDGTTEYVTVDLDYIESADDLYRQAEEVLGDKLFYISNEPDILAEAGMPPVSDEYDAEN